MGSWGVGGTVSGRKEPSCRPGPRKRQYLAWRVLGGGPGTEH